MYYAENKILFHQLVFILNLLNLVSWSMIYFWMDYLRKLQVDPDHITIVITRATFKTKYSSQKTINKVRSFTTSWIKENLINIVLTFKYTFWTVSSLHLISRRQYFTSSFDDANNYTYHKAHCYICCVYHVVQAYQFPAVHSACYCHVVHLGFE